MLQTSSQGRFPFVYPKCPALAFSGSLSSNWATYLVGYIEIIGPLQVAIHVVQNRRAGEQSRTGTRQKKTSIILNCNFLCLSCLSATFAHQHGGFVPREWLPAKGLMPVFPVLSLCALTMFPVPVIR